MSQGLHIASAIKGIVDQARCEILEAGLKLLPISSFVQFMSGAFQLFWRDIAALLSRELESAPVRPVLDILIQIIEVVIAARCSDKQRLALFVC